jgi:site-specific DNA-methyltransferase (adenine-specific)
VDLVVTDPPYAIGFMGKGWDKQLPPKEAFQEMFRVLKDGALAFVMSSPRQDVMWRMLKLLEDCGFEMRQSFISWVYASGFPKGLDVSKGIDKKLGLKRKKIKASGSLHHTRLNDDGWSKIGQAEALMDSSEPVSPEAKEWQGWQSMAGLKPALECILMVNKPFSEKTIVDQVLKTGTGAVNVDACRIPFTLEGSPSANRWGGKTPSNSTLHFGLSKPVESQIENERGRFPANLLVSDQALNNGKITKSEGGTKPIPTTGNTYGEYDKANIDYYNYGDVGSFCRYFDLDAWAKHHGFLNVPKASNQERNQGLGKANEKLREGDYGIFDSRSGSRKEWVRHPKKNFHPTVKPVKLMAYLIELGCQPKGIVLDPFCGSGSTLIAAQMLRRKWIGIEIESDYCKIAQARVKEAMKDRSIEEFTEL